MLEKLHDVINKQLTAHPESVIIAAGDFTFADVKLAMPKHHKNVNFPTSKIIIAIMQQQKYIYDLIALNHANSCILVSLLPKKPWQQYGFCQQRRQNQLINSVEQGSSTFFRPRTPKLIEKWNRGPLLYILYIYNMLTER